MDLMTLSLQRMSVFRFLCRIWLIFEESISSITDTQLKVKLLSMAYPMAVGFRSILFSSISLCPETGMLVGGTINRAPEGLFGAAVAEGGLFDFLKVCECS